LDGNKNISPSFYRDVYCLAIFLYPDVDTAFKLIKQLFSLIKMKIFAGIWSTDNHNYIVTRRQRTGSCCQQVASTDDGYQKSTALS
jgi:hypothetical protein